MLSFGIKSSGFLAVCPKEPFCQMTVNQCYSRQKEYSAEELKEAYDGSEKVYSTFLIKLMRISNEKVQNLER